MNNNKSGGIGRILILLVIVGISFFIVKNVGVDNITKKANNTLDSVSVSYTHLTLPTKA